ncbi:hypothetical protein FQN60_002159 [Etheostoma spectabile]|uniref:DUF4743 domain-containing protein n=1 Tax=Etheostoma spectabile TaxID=54343 RepID=A0A5J5DDE3_9PERO|nr:hypothetical protein FQN60_002159 [Etheostoma spectabile]
MAKSAWSEKMLQLLRRMNNFSLPGSCRPECFRFEINDAQVGWIRPHVAPLLARHPEVFAPPHGGAVALRPGLDTYDRRSAAKYSVMPKFSDPPMMWMERAATSLFGVKRGGVHINGYTVSEGGEVSMWLARRSSTKQTYPGLLDNVPAVWLLASASNTPCYTYEEEDGVFAENQFVFDLELPRDFKPRVGDGEVHEFYLLPIEKVKELLATEDFKPNCAMVVLDFLIRHSFIEPDTEPCYQEFVAGLHQTLE